MLFSRPAPAQKPTPSAISRLIADHTPLTQSQDRHSSSSSNALTTPDPNLALALEIQHNLQHQHNWHSLELHNLSLPSPTPNPSTSSSSSSTTQYILSGIPPPSKQLYVHPDLQLHLLRHGLSPADLAPQREYILPLSLKAQPTLRFLSGVFDAVPPRDVLRRSSDGEVLLLRQAGKRSHVSTGSDKSTSSVSIPSEAETEPEAEQSTPTREPASPQLSSPAAAPAAAPADHSTSVSSTTTTTPPQVPSDPEQDKGTPYRDAKRVLLALKAGDGRGGDGTVAYYVCLEGEVKPRQNG
jgi:tRNA-splicing endonuclease subunit Sen15, fungi type